jgi:hypothetical protein
MKGWKRAEGKATRGAIGLGLPAAYGGRLMGVRARKRERFVITAATRRFRFLALTPIS